MKIRKEVLQFAQDMERKLQANDHKGGWKDEDYDWLFDQMKKELKEVEEIFDKLSWSSLYDLDDSVKKSIIDELADVANFAMMIADQIKTD